MFSMLPGAGHMFLGFMKMGLSFMTMFFGVIMFAALLRFEFILFALPIIWFYSFFDCINKTFPAYDVTVTDRYILLPEPFPIFAGKHRLILGFVLTLLGIYLLANNAFSIARRLLPQVDLHFWRIQGIINSIPQLIIAFAIIVLGIAMIVGKKKELNQPAAIELVTTNQDPNPSSDQM